MGDGFSGNATRRVASGDRLVISARAWNGAMLAAEQAQQNNSAAQAQRQIVARVSVLRAELTSAIALSPGDVVRIDDAQVLVESFGGVPDTRNLSGPDVLWSVADLDPVEDNAAWGVLREPVEQFGFAEVAMDGLAWARLFDPPGPDALVRGDSLAPDLSTAATRRLRKSGRVGSGADLVWFQESHVDDETYGLVRLGGGGDGRMGKITAITAIGVTPLLPPGALYKAVSDDGTMVVDAFQRPLFRPYNDAPLVIAAQVGTPCWMVMADGTPAIFACDERLNFAPCDNGSGTALGASTGMGSEFWVVDESGSVVIGDDGNVVVAAERSLPGNPENLIVVGDDGEPVSDECGNLVVYDDGSGAIEPCFFDRVVIGDDGNVVVGDDGEVVTVWDGTNGAATPVIGA